MAGRTYILIPSVLVINLISYASTTKAKSFYSNLNAVSLTFFLPTAVILLNLIERASKTIDDVVRKTFKILEF